MSDVRVVYRKFDGSLHWHFSGRLLGEDEHGVWVGCVPDTTARRGHELTVVWDHASVLLFPRAGWWTASFNAEPNDTAVYCDISTVPVWQDGEGPGSEVTMIDLDLDVVKQRDGTVYVDDEDEFAEHQVRYGYPADVVSRAEQAAAWLTGVVRAGDGAFGGAHEAYLAAVTV